MKTIIKILCLVIIFPNVISAQIHEPTKNPKKVFEEKIKWQKEREPTNYNTYTKNFIELFNTNNIAKIFEQASDELKEQASVNKLTGFLKFFKNNNGDIKVIRFRYFDKKNQRHNEKELANYYLEFENGSQWDLRFGLDQNNKLFKIIITDNNYNEDLPLYHSKSKLMLPFDEKENWYVLWGGETENDNYHVVSRSQKNAIDFLIKHPWNKKTFKTDGKTNADYYAFNKSIYSPVNGKIVKVINAVKDNTPGQMNRKQLTGNTIVIKSDNDEYVLLAHFKQNSIKVRKNQSIKMGEFLGLCGNSGNSSEPHLHIQVMDNENMGKATGLKIFFEALIINNTSKAEHYSPTRGDYVKLK